MSHMDTDMTVKVLELFLIGISALFVWIQVRDLRISIQSQTYQTVYEKMFEFHRFFFEHPEMKKFFYHGTDLPDEDGERLEIVAEWMCDYFDDVYHQRRTMPPATFDEWKTFMQEIYENSPVLRRHIARRQLWYPEAYLSVLTGDA